MEKRDQSVERHDDGSRVRKPTYAVEVCFLVVMFGVVLAAFIEAFNYKLVSSRTPFVIMVPLLGLIIWHATRLLKGDAWREVKFHIASALSGHYKAFSKLTKLTLAFVALWLTILFLGHYIAIAAFMVFSMYVMGGERLKLALVVGAVATVVIYALFEHGFNIELYRGLFFRYLAGYRDF